MSFNHQSVLLNEVIDALDVQKDQIYVDATLGAGGHTKLILNKLISGHLYSFDQDLEAIKHAQKRFVNSTHITLINDNFVNLKMQLKANDIKEVAGIVFDLGVSSPQIDTDNRGFSYMKSGPLDMRMNQSMNFSAIDVVNKYSIEQLTKIFKDYGEEKFAYKIAKAINTRAQIEPIITTLDLVEIIKYAIPKKFYYQLNSHPAKKVFQAIRIEVNHELEFLESALKQSFEMLKIDGVLVVITFHSLEDRITKKYFKQLSNVKTELKYLPMIPIEHQPSAKLINNKVIIPSEQEINNNPRAKSAKLRIIKKVK